MKRTLVFIGLASFLCIFSVRGLSQVPPAGASHVVDAASQVPDQSYLILSPETKGYARGSISLYYKIDILPDPSGVLTFEEVSSPPFEDRFISNLELLKTHDPKDAAHWVRITLLSDLRETEIWYLWPIGTDIVLYTPDGAGGYFARRSGMFVPWSERDTTQVVKSGPVFPVVVRPKEAQTLYWRHEDRIRFFETVRAFLFSGDYVRIYDRDQRLGAGIFTGVTLGIGLVYLLLWAFLRDRSTLFFSLMCLGSSLFWLFWRGYIWEYILPEHPVAAYRLAMGILVPVLLYSGIRFPQTYLEMRRFTPRLNGALWVSMACYALFLAAFALVSGITYQVLMDLVAVGAIVQAVLLLAAAGIIVRKGYRPARIYLAAFTLANVGGALYLLNQAGYLVIGKDLYWLHTGGVMAAFILFALGLVDRFRLLREEKAKAEAEAERERRELEQARELQLSMLPAEPPKLSGFEVATAMRTATEVGGDYYDYVISEDGALTVAVGDATGHGMAAGTLVASVKSLFTAFARTAGPAELLGECSRALHGMGFAKMPMAFTAARVDGGKVTIASAGMPFPLVYRADSGAVEEVSAGGLPLGIMVGFPYEEEEIALEPGDVLLLMSDGFPEMFDPKGEILGFERAGEIFRQAADGEPEAIVRHLIEAGENWAQGRPQEDDVTFLAIRGTGP